MAIEKTYQIPIRGTSIIICRSKGINGYIDTVIETVPEENYRSIKIGVTKHFSKKYNAVINDNYILGELDFNNDNTVNLINDFFDIRDKENFVPTSFNYETSTISTTDGVIKGAPTWNNVKYIKYLHCQLGKPKYVIIFKIWQKKYKKN